MAQTDDWPTWRSEEHSRDVQEHSFRLAVVAEMKCRSLTGRRTGAHATGLILLALALGSCSLERNRTAQQAETKLIGMSRAELYRCAGLPHRELVIDGVTIATYDNQLQASNALTLPIIGGGLTQGTSNYCRTTFTFENGAVSSVNYTGATGPFYAEHEQCAYTVQACLKIVEDRAKAAGPTLLPEAQRPSYSELSRPRRYDQP
jgi:hypothetical protein